MAKVELSGTISMKSQAKQNTPAEAQQAAEALPNETPPVAYLTAQCKTCGASPTFTQGGNPKHIAVCGMCGLVTERAQGA